MTWGPASPCSWWGWCGWRWCWLSGRERDLPQTCEGFGEGQRPGPVFGQPQEDFALAAGDSGCGVQQPVPQALGFSAVQVGLGRQEHRLGQGEEVGGDQRELDPDLVDVLVPARQVPEAGVLPGPDPVLDPGVRTMPRLEEGELAAGVLVVKA